ncbi:MAG: hypothetical protein H0X25_01830 [Acidobacteriales bacterium]|nr:hypothetical protein [Terriglobales bacterium]
MSRWHKSTALFCLLLTLWSGAALLVHHHSSTLDAHVCPVAAAAHAIAFTCWAEAPRPQAIHSLHVVLATASAKQRILSFGLSVRPPPTA